MTLTYDRWCDPPDEPTTEQEIEELKESIEISTKKIEVFKLNIHHLKVYRSEKLSRLQGLKSQLSTEEGEEG